MKAKTYGSGWHKESLRHSRAKKLGHAGGTYANNLVEVNRIKKGLYEVSLSGQSQRFTTTRSQADRIAKRIPSDKKPILSYTKLKRPERFPETPIKNTMVLPVQFSITIPSTQDIDQDIGKKEMKERLKEAKKWMIDRFMGDTTILGKGDYNTDGKLIEEDVGIINVSTTPESYEGHKAELAKFIKDKREEYGQKQMAFNIENDLFLYPKNPKRPYIKHLSKSVQK
jgi:hypothetical protein